MTSKVDVIIPARNEAGTVAGVVSAAKSCDLVRHVTVVSDGSEDGTVAAARTRADLVIEVKPGRGKGAAMLLGARYADGDFLLFLDGDLIALTPEHVRQIAEPVLSGEVDMNVGVVARGSLYNWLARRTPKISGQRAIKRVLLDSVSSSRFGGYGAEMELNAVARASGAKIGLVFLHNMTFVKKYQKTGWARAIVDYARMIIRISTVWTVSLFRRI